MKSNVRGRGNQTRDEIEQQISRSSEDVLDVVAEDPEDPEVSYQVTKGTMKEDRRDKAEEHTLVCEYRGRGRRAARCGANLVDRERLPGDKLTGDGRILVQEPGSGFEARRLHSQEDVSSGNDDQSGYNCAAP